MSGPWYENSGPNKEYVYKDIMGFFKNKFENKNIAYVTMNYGYLSLLVKKLMNIEYLKYGSYGSYRGYSSFTRKTIIEAVMDELKKRKKKIAFYILTHSRILHILKDSVLYKPGKQRVKHLENNFNDLKNNIKY